MTASKGRWQLGSLWVNGTIRRQLIYIRLSSTNLALEFLVLFYTLFQWSEECLQSNFFPLYFSVMYFLLLHMAGHFCKAVHLSSWVGKYMEWVQMCMCTEQTLGDQEEMFALVVGVHDSPFPSLWQPWCFLLLNPQCDWVRGWWCKWYCVYTYRSGIKIHIYICTYTVMQKRQWRWPTQRTMMWKVLSYVNDFNAFQDLLLHPIHFSLDLDSPDT